MTVATRLMIWKAVAVTVAFEVVTIILRFGLDFQTTRDSASMARFTFGLRIHHGYVGFVFLLIAAFLKPSRVRDWAWILGVALVASDLAHHFLVLWPITGSPHFDLTYGRFR